MTKLNALASALARGDYQTFNAHPDRATAFISKLRLKASGLRNFDLTGVEFAFCTFEDCFFSDIVGIKFTKCMFKRCKIERPRTAAAVSVKDALFVHCEFEKVTFEAAHFDGAQFKRNTFNKVRLTAEGTTIRSSTFHYNAGLERVTDLHAIDLAPVDISYRPAPPTLYDRVVNWRVIALFSRLPILNISYIFLVALAGYAIIMSSLLNVVGELASRLPAEFIPPLSSAEVMGWFRRIAIPRAEALWIVAAFILLALAGTIYKLAAPSQVQEYSLDKWMLEVRRHVLTYTSLLYLRTVACFASVAFTAVAFGILVVITVLKFGSVLSILTSNA